MTRVSDNYQSVIRGVSEQVPHDRIPGQHWEQVNMNSDPVRGLSRRHGSIQMAVQSLAGPITAYDKADASNRGEVTLFVEGAEVSFLHRYKAHPNSQLHPLIVTDKETKQFIPVVYSDAEVGAILADGVTSMCSAGRYVLVSSATRPVRHTVTDNMAPTSSQHVVWIRGGANSRTFTVIITVAGVEKKYEHTTLPAYYEGVLDTSDINISENYAKLVNDRVNAYNTAVNQHIAAVAKDITPANIASKIADKIKVDYPTARAEGAYIILDIPGAIVTTEDGGNGELMRAVSQEVTDAALVTPWHFPGKVIRVVPKAANALAFYLKANSVSGSTEFGEVVWRETAGEGVKIDWAFCVGAFVGGTFHIGKSPESLAAATGLEVPKFEDASSGDKDSNPRPEFMSRIINHMRMFQDRLMIVSGSTVFLSKSGDYFNWFRKSVLTLADDDPIEVYAQGTEDDIITTGVQHDRNVILCGKRYQYIVPGRENMTPRNPYVGVQASYEGADLAPHASAGSLLFFCQRRERRLTLQRMQPGVVVDRLDALDVSNQLDGYFAGTPRQIVAMTAPGAVFVRTVEMAHGFYVYSYLDSEDNSERLFDSWSRWEFNSNLGVLAGITADDSGLLAVTVRTTKNGPALVLDRFTRETGPSNLPYLDSMTTYANSNHVAEGSSVAFGDVSGNYLLGLPLTKEAEIPNQFPGDLSELRAGADYDSYVIPTSPYVRDRNDKIILDARVTVSKIVIGLSNSAAMRADVSTDMGQTWKPSKSWVYRNAGQWVLNTQEVAEEFNVTAPIMKENKAYRLRISSRSWLPMTISSLEWAGQIFTSRR